MHRDVLRRYLLAGGATAALTALAGCVVAGRAVEDPIEETVDAASLEALRVETRTGLLSVVGEPRETVGIRGRKVAATEDALESVGFDVETVDGVLEVTGDPNDRRGGFRFGSSPRVDLELAVPDDLRVAYAGTRNGTVDVRSVTGDTHVVSRNGRVSVVGVDGSAAVETRNGAVDLADVTGGVTVSTRNGNVDAASVTHDLVVETRNGTVDVGISRSLETAIRLRSRNGRLSVETPDESHTARSALDVTVGAGTHRLAVETRNGNVSIALE
ncbi:DUF4097 domain-containing protein [Natronobiforma cellulositropha]|uniref:DUF4097 domain-containing protein n=1 Tax=Natronobiforma cellulositropha TaxID=1679076 RepID=UPI0021D5739B|nr:DUF4097 domain-containing protein [Natronobiforma cellulositropha]